MKGLNVTPQAFTIPEYIGYYKVGRTKLYEEIASGRLSTYKVGRRRYISAHAADEWQKKLEKEARPVDAVNREVGATGAAN